MIKTIFKLDLGPITLYCYNQSAIANALDNKFHSRTKHMALPYHFVHHAVVSGVVSLQWIDTASNVADIFTKPLDAVKTARFSGGLGLTV